MLSEYIDKKLAIARYKLLADGTYFGEITGLRGVWAEAKSLEQCRKQLQDVLEEWLLHSQFPSRRYFETFARGNLAPSRN